jgi:hypothetical protein
MTKAAAGEDALRYEISRLLRTLWGSHSTYRISSDSIILYCRLDLICGACKPLKKIWLTLLYPLRSALDLRIATTLGGGIQNATTICSPIYGRLALCTLLG